MGLFGRLFGSKDDLPALRKAISQHRFADARLIAVEIDAKVLSAEEQDEFARLRTEAGDRLAQLNLDEGAALQRSGDADRALEHFELAREQAVSDDLIKQIDQALKQEPIPGVAPAPVRKKAAGGSCASCGPAPATEPLQVEDDDLPDFDSRVELILASYPPEMAERYRTKSPGFLQAFLIAHEEEPAKALKALKEVSTEEKDDLYYFEVGSLHGRLEKIPDAIKYLKKALDTNPDLLLAAETLVTLQVARNQVQDALSRLEEMLKKGRDPLFCHTQLATVKMQLGDREHALEHAQQALSLGSQDQQLIFITASMMEQKGELKAAEKLYSSLSAGGCGGGANVYLAEFWLRQNKNLAKALDSFNAICRQEPDNPRWQLRVAQTYIARKWDKQGLDLLRRVLPDPNLAPELRAEGEALLASRSAS
ncbi:MAG: hypothetical protein C0618_01950 [Desulfuromonas sp.]|nr:MAG: hypothetical protein C0618_01950 [Desulfuromonas sp.]